MRLDAARPLIDFAVFRREVYLLMALLLADQKVGKMAAIRDAALDYYDGEVGNRLIFIAASARRMMVQNAYGEVAARVCGEFSHSRMSGGKRRPLDFHRACSAIIHAVQIWAYEAPLPKDGGGREFYDGKITVRSKDRGGQSIAVLDGAIFAECCIILADNLVSK